MPNSLLRSWFLLLSLPLLAAGLPDRIKPGERYVHPGTGLEVVTGEVLVPKGLTRVYLRPAPGETGMVSPGLYYRGQSPRPTDLDPIPYQVIAQRRGKAGEARLELVDDTGAKVAELLFPMPTRMGDAKGLELWVKNRLWEWEGYSGDPPPFRTPLREVIASAYGFDVYDFQRSRWERNQSGGPSLLALLGGRAAVDETLQLDRELPRQGQEKSAKPPVPIASLHGIDTPPHPWKEMRSVGPQVTPPALADCVPLDRALLYLPRPKAALASLEGGGAAFLQRVSSFSGQGVLDTNIVTRMMEDLGLGSGRGRRLIESGAVREAVIFFPDLAFLAGTEATVVADLARPEEGRFVPEGSPHGFKTAGGQAFAARRGGRLFLSTSRVELDRALALHDLGGRGSLGQSDEFAVVLGKLAPTADTELFAYFSDAFIRSLVGPRQRILLSRQAQARQAMETLAAAALLRRLDFPGETPTLAQLQARGYVPKTLDTHDLSLSPEGQVRHVLFGPLERLHPLARVPLAQVSAEEAQAYKFFKEAYSQYWVRYFDPIAFRLEAKADGRQELETFVLPLLDSSIYKPFREQLAEDGNLPRPHWQQPMVLELAARLTLKGSEEPGTRYKGARALEILRLIGTGVVAVGFPDAAPAIATGSGSPATILAADPFNERKGLLSIGALGLGLFTRPMVLALELKDPATTRKSLKGMVQEALQQLGVNMREFETHLTEEPDGSLRLRLGLLGLASMRFSIKVEERWLVLSNDPSLPPNLVAGTKAGEPFAASLSLHPEALHLGLSDAFHAAMEGEARSAFAAMAWLGPWLQLNHDVQAAQAESRRILGVAPLLAPDALQFGRGRTEHRDFGRPGAPRTPPRDPAKDFGLLEGVREPVVDMRFEDTGLRARVSWRR